MIISTFKQPRTFQPQNGFTLVELLLVVSIIALLAAIAIPQFISYRSRSIDAQMKTDLKNAATAMESYYAQHQTYPNTVGEITAVGFSQTSGVTLTITITSSSSFTLTASKPDGSQASFSFDNTTGLIY